MDFSTTLDRVALVTALTFSTTPTISYWPEWEVTKSDCEFNSPFQSSDQVEQANQDDREFFARLSETWRKETRRSSVIALRYANPAYQSILALGDKAIPWILEELKIRPDRWFAALKALSKLSDEQDPAAQCESFDSAVEAWLNWGRDHGHNV